LHVVKVVLIAYIGFLILAAAACGSNSPELPLLDAIEQENVGVVQEHIDFGTDINDSFVPLGMPFAGASSLHLAVLKNNAEITRMLLDGGAHIEIRSKDPTNATPLAWAAYWGIREMTRLLVESGAEINSKDAFGSTVLDAASADNPFIPPVFQREFYESRAFIMEYSLNKGAN